MIQRKKKACKCCGTEQFIWAHGLCKVCSMKSKPIKIQTKAKSPTGEKALFDEIWDSRPHVSYVSGISLEKYYGTKLYPNLFSHCLPKGKYPEHRLNPDNIVMVSPQEHLDWHSLAKDKLLEKNPNWQKVFDLCESLKTI